MAFEDMEKQLYHACLKGDVEALEALTRDDELTLSRILISSCSNQTPLHLASMLGHFEFAKSLLSFERGFASRSDSQGRSPLHLASAKGYTDIVEVLLEHDPSMCGVLDEDGRTPLHLAIMNGQDESVTKLIELNHGSLHEEGTALQLCILYNRLNVLISILELNNHQDLINMEDENGETIVHSATALRRIQIIKYLVKSRSEEVDLNVVSKHGVTALDVVEQMPNKDVKTLEIRELLKSAGALSANEIKKEVTTSNLIIPQVRNQSLSIQPTEPSVNTRVRDGVAAAYNNDGGPGKGKLREMWKQVKNFSIFQEKKEKKDETLLVAATVIAAMAYQAAISPPGGIAGMDATEETDNSKNPFGKTYYFGPAYSLLALFEPDISNAFWIFNTISFSASLSVIFIYVSGATLKRPFFIWLIRASMWITLSSMTFAYSYAVKSLTPKTKDDKFNQSTYVAVELGLYIWIGLVSLSFLVIVCRSIRYLAGKKRATRKTNIREPAAAFRAQNPNYIV